MPIVECCDNCKRQFEQFDLVPNPDDPEGPKEAYGFVVREGDVEVLLSDLTFAFTRFLEPKPEREDKCDYWCVKCIEAVSDTGDDE